MKKNNLFKNIYLVLISVLSLSFISCVEDAPSYNASDWEGRWQINEEIVFPKNPKTTYTGNIKAVDDYNIIIGGELFGLNSSCKVAATVSSKTAKFDQIVSGAYQLVGTATLNADTITFKFDVKVDDKSRGYTRKAIKLQ